MFKWFWTIFSLGAALPVVIDCGRATVEFDIFQLNSNSHFAVTRNPIIWRLVGHSHDFLMGASYHVWVYQVIIPIKKNCIACSCSMCLESGSLVRNRGIEENEWGLGTVVLTHPQRVNVWCTSAREGDGRREGDPRTSRAQNPLFLLFQRADKNRICFSVVFAYSSAYTRKTCHLFFFISHTFYLAYLWSSSLHKHWRLWSWYQYSQKCEWFSFIIWVCPA